MKKIIFMCSFFFMTKAMSQVGINTPTPNSTLTINGSLAAKYNEISSAYTLTKDDYFVSYIGNSDALITLPSVGNGNTSFTGRIYRIKNISSNNLTLQPANGNFLRSTDLTGAANFIIPPGNYVEVVNNSNTSSTGVPTWDLSFIGNTEVITTSADATRFLGGTVYVKFAQSSAGTLDNSLVIVGNYSVGLNNTNITPTKGGINSLIGNGYRISNPSTGIYDIKFNTSYTQIYGISVNIVDAYGSTGSSVSSGQNPDSTRAGSILKTTDNAQVSFISNDIIRIKTGAADGNLGNRPFTFLVTGR